MRNTKMEEAIKDRLLNGFKNWNGGYDCWLEWCNTLYEPDSHYNVNGKRLTLQEYKDMMKEFLSNYDIKMGEFQNMLIEDDWCGIRYKCYHINRRTNEKIEQESFEFVHFKDNPEPIGVRVIEGWATSTSPIEL